MDKGFSILFVDDEKSIRDGIEMFLKRFCDKLYLASNGEEALEIYTHNDVDIVISDIRMPKMNGIDLAKKIKGMDEEQVVIFVTAYSDSAFFLEAIELQVDAFIVKPIDYEKLEKKILFFRRNIKEKKELNRKQMLLDKIVELTKNFLIVLDEDKNITVANRAFLSFFGVKTVGEFKRRVGCLKNVIKVDDGETFANHKEWIDELEKHIKKDELFSLKERYFKLQIHKIEETGDIVLVFNDVTDIERERISLKYKSFKDDLTAIYNRAYFNEELKKSIANYKRSGIPFSLIMFDIDHFKNINDTYGHLTGDEVLKNLAKLISGSIRESDIFARWGGEEFMVILPDTNMEKATKVASQLRKKIKKEPITANLTITCSFGVTMVLKNDTVDTLTNRVDEALYEAKRGGRDKVVVK